MVQWVNVRAHAYYWLPFPSLVSFPLTSGSMIFPGFPRWKVLWSLWRHHFSQLARARSVWLKQIAVACNDKHSSPPCSQNDVSQEETDTAQLKGAGLTSSVQYGQSSEAGGQIRPVPVTPASTGGRREARSCCWQSFIHQWPSSSF